MNDGYTAIFEVSYFSNGWLLWDLGYLAAGIVALTLFIRTRRPGSRQQKVSIPFLCIWGTIWFLFAGFSLYFNLMRGQQYTAALANNKCEIVEGAVQSCMSNHPAATATAIVSASATKNLPTVISTPS